MKMIRKLSLLLLSLIVAGNGAFAQFKIIVKSKSNIQQLQLRNTNTGTMSQIPTWNKTGGGFLLAVADLNKTEIVASSFMEIQLYRIDTKEPTDWIQLNTGQKISLSDCFDIYGNSGAAKTDDMANVSEFFSSVFTGYSVSGTNMVVRGASSKIDFETSSPNFLETNELSISWKARAEIDKILLMNLTTNQVVWQAAAGFNESKIDYNTIASDLGPNASELLKLGNDYELQFMVKNEKDPVKQKFSITPAYFNLDNTASVLSWENLNISWKSINAPDYAWIEDAEGNAVWEAEQPTISKIDFAFLQNQMEIFESGKYKLVLEYNNIKVPFLFEVFASPEEVEELKGFLVQ
jgi:hypothetical protein